MIDLSISNNLFINNQLDEALQELDLLFNVECTELIGDTTFGVSLQQFLWSLTPTIESLREYLNNKLKELKYLNLYKYNLDIKHNNDDYKSTYQISIDIYLDNDEKIKKEYTF